MNILELFDDWEDVVKCKRGAELFAERAPADFMYVILDGEIELSLHNEPLGVEMDGGIIGEMAMIVDSNRSATATTLTKSKLARVNRDQFRELVASNPDFALHIMQILANRLRAINEQVTSQYSRYS